MSGIMKPHLYINSKGYFVTRHSYSGGDTFNFCAQKYYLERVQGWSERIQRAASQFGIALEHAVTFWHQHRQDTPAAVAEFKRLWAAHKDTDTLDDQGKIITKGTEYVYSKPEKDWATLNLTGSELVRLYTILYPTLPYVVNNPHDSFQVQSNFEVFPGTKLAGIEFTSYIDLIAERKADGKPVIVDMKTSAKDIPELLMLDPQLRSYSWVKEYPHVAFLWFRKMGRTVSRGDSATMLLPYAGLLPGTVVMVMATDDFGVWVTTDEKNYTEMSEKFVGEAKAVKLARQGFVEGKSVHVSEASLTKQRVQFAMATITPESREDIGRSIKRDVVNIASANEKNFWPMQSGVRFPNEKCPNCSMRGICANKPELRDLLVIRKQEDMLDFGGDAE